MTVAYLTAYYPATTHSFIRREIAGLEADGIHVERFATRPPCNDLVSPEDLAEQRRTRAILDVGTIGLTLAFTKVALAMPIRMARALRLAFALGRRSERGHFRHLAYVAEACALLRWVRDCGADHVHAHFGTNSAAIAALCHALGGPPYSFTAHGSADIGKAGRMALGEKIQRAEFVVAVSEFGRSQLCRVCDAEHWPKIHVVHCGVDESFLDAPGTPMPLSPHLVCIGRLSAEKGHEVLIEAARRLAKEGVAFEVTLVGDGPRRRALETLIQQYGLNDRIRIMGWAGGAEVRGRIQASRALVLPSHYEGLPVVIMEAFALGRPVIATRVGGVPELVEPGLNGWLADPGSPGELADAMRQALTAPVQELERMGSAGASRVREQHDAAIEARKLSRLFQKSIAAGASGAVPPSRPTGYPMTGRALLLR